MKFFSKKRKKLDADELEELREFTRMVNYEKFKLIQVENNTLLIPGGKDLAKQQKALVELYERVKGEFVGRKLRELGFEQNEKVNIGLNNGRIWTQ